MIPLLFTSIVWLFFAHFALAGKLVSPNWRNPNITISPDERIGIASAGLEEALSHLDTARGEAYDVAGRLFSQLAEFDLLTGQKKYQDTVATNLRLAKGNNFSDELTYGRASVKAFSAYKNQTFLDFAVASWWSGRNYTLSQADVSSGKTPVKSFPLSQVCKGLTMAGGTFHTTDSDDPGIVGLATGNFLVLSALLAEATSDPMYLQAASESADFIHAQLDNIANVVQDGVSARQNDSCSPNNIAKPYNSGLTIEGLSILASITGQASTLQLLSDTITATIPNHDWQGDNGIIFGSSLELVNGLSAAYARNVTKAELREDIKAYLGVQFNAVLDLSTTPGTNRYSGSWTGPPLATFSALNQTMALGPILSAIQLHNDSSLAPSNPEGSPSPRENPPPSPSSKPPIGIIIGGAVGGVALLAGAFAVMWIMRRRRRRVREIEAPPLPSPILSSGGRISPFTESRAFASSSNLSTLPLHEKLSRIAPMRSQRTGNAGEHTEGATLPSSAGPATHSVDLPTAELVRLLNDRLQHQKWNEHEPPPNYSVP
ncbi:hypothetical protein C8J57DRAFT_1590036 [Mycena rebaudengoi]|nr:hypothetical protein C8J57DRAFT_1590036 [Mycena rebaudengoi]